MLTKGISLNPDSWELHMNMSCFYTAVGQIGLSLKHTDESIKILEPLGGEGTPLAHLKEQKARLEKMIKEAQNQGTSIPDQKGDNHDRTKSTSNNDGGSAGEYSESEQKTAQPVGS